MASHEDRKTPVPSEIDVKQLKKDLKSEIGRWYDLAFQLRVDRKKIEIHSRKTPVSCFSEVLELWLMDEETGDRRNRKWKGIYDALQEDYGRLASELEEKYPPHANVELDAVDLQRLLRQVTPKWLQFGINLGFQMYELEAIQAGKGPEWCFLEVLQTWLNKKECYWEQLVEALEGIRNKKLARKIEEKYIQVIEDVSNTEPAVEVWYANVDDTLLNEQDHYVDVLKEINDVIKWDDLGLSLGISYAKLECIREDCRTIEKCRKQMLSEWFRNPPDKREPSWLHLCLAIADGMVGQVTLAKNIAKHHKKEAKPYYGTAVLEEGKTTANATDGENSTEFDSSTNTEPASVVVHVTTPSSGQQPVIVAPTNQYQDHNVIDTTSDYPQDAVTDTHDKH